MLTYDADEWSRGTNDSYVFTLGCMGRARIFAKVYAALSY
jgi:hypothetical protein